MRSVVNACAWSCSPSCSSGFAAHAPLQQCRIEATAGRRDIRNVGVAGSSTTIHLGARVRRWIIDAPRGTLEP